LTHTITFIPTLLPGGTDVAQPGCNGALIPSAAVRILLVVNSFASSVTARNTVTVHRELSRAHDVDVVETNRRGHAIRFAQDAARRELDAVIAFGGDGTLNEVATGVAGSGTALGVLPGGSTNVFARTIGMPNDPVAAVGPLMAGLRANDLRPIGLGRVNGRYFCFHTGVGFDAAVVAAVERHASLKRWFGHPLFIWAGLTTWWRGYDRSRPQFTLRTDDGRTCDEGRFTVVLNTNPYTYLGNRALDVAPSAGLSNALVAVTFTDLQVMTLIRALGSSLRGGGLAAADGVLEWSAVKGLTIETIGDRGVPFQADGDHLGDVASLRFEHVPNAVRLVWPGQV
jgi:diacylglycerol kinase family enzyme